MSTVSKLGTCGHNQRHNFPISKITFPKAEIKLRMKLRLTISDHGNYITHVKKLSDLSCY
jgi:hypothetical protein